MGIRWRVLSIVAGLKVASFFFDLARSITNPGQQLFLELAAFLTLVLFFASALFGLALWLEILKKGQKVVWRS